MALSRKFLSAMGIEADKIDEIISAHADTVDALKEERDKYKNDLETYKEDAEKLPAIQRELDELKNSNGNDIFEKKYNDMKEQHDALKEEFEKYKSDVADAEIKRTKESAYRNLLKELKISDKRIDKILKVSDIDAMELDKDGNLKDVDNLKESIREDWGDFIVTEGTAGANVATPNNVNNQVPKGQSRAAKIAAQYHTNLYGENPKEGN